MFVVGWIVVLGLVLSPVITFKVPYKVNTII